MKAMSTGVYAPTVPAPNPVFPNSFRLKAAALTASKGESEGDSLLIVVTQTATAFPFASPERLAHSALDTMLTTTLCPS